MIKKIQNRVTSLDRATDIIEFTASCGKEIPISHIVTNLDIPLQSLIRTLDKDQLILPEQLPGSKYFHKINSSED